MSIQLASERCVILFITRDVENTANEMLLLDRKFDFFGTKISRVFKCYKIHFEAISPPAA